MTGLQRFRTRPTPVEAIQHDGRNLEEINGLVRLIAGGSIAEGLAVGSWVVFTGTSWQVLPNVAFRKVYEPDPVATAREQAAKDQRRTCFACAHYAMSNSGVGHCLLFDEQIDSEIYAAADCSGYEEEDGHG